MLFGIFDEVIHIRTNGLYATLHRRYSVTLSGRTDSDAPFSPEVFMSHVCGAAAMSSGKVAAEDEYLVRF